MYLKKFCCIAAQCAAMRRIAPPYLFWGKDAFFRIKTNFRCLIISLNLMYAAKAFFHMSSLLLHNKFCNWVIYIYFIVILIKYHHGGAMRRIALQCSRIFQNHVFWLSDDKFLNWETHSTWFVFEIRYFVELCLSRENIIENRWSKCHLYEKTIFGALLRNAPYCAAMLQNLIFLMRRIAAQCAALRRITSFTPKSHKSWCKQFYTMKYVRYWNMAKHTLRHLGSPYYFPEIKKIFFQFFIDFRPHSHI